MNYLDLLVIFREVGSKPLVKSFQHIEPTPQGKIEIYFTRAVNYPSISAIEVIPAPGIQRI
jgi:hypothetical protein